MNTVPRLVRYHIPEQAEWLAADGTVQQGTLADLAGQHDARRLLLIAPGEAVVLSAVTLPFRQRAKRLQAIPYALEDQLADTVEDLHFALGDSQGLTTVVAAVRRNVLDGWLAACSEAGLNVAAVLPEPLLLPYSDDAWSLLLDGERAVVRTGPWQGFAGDHNTLALHLQLALAEAGESPPTRLRLWGEAPPALAELGLELHQEATQPQPLAVFAAGYQPTTLNLLQGSYSRQANLSRWLRPWRFAAALAGLWVGLQLVAQVGEYWQLHREQTQLRLAMEQVYKDAVPDARKLVNPRAQLETRLRELRQGTDSPAAAFLDLLYRGSQPLPGMAGITLRGLRYKENELDLDLESSNLELLDQLKQRLGEQPQVQIEMRTTKRDDKVESQLTLRRAPS
jgi:general secretion pathway protein L